MSMTTNSASGRATEMNVTPLIDVLLVILIIFMMMPPKSTGLNTLVPQPQPEPQQLSEPSNDIVLQVLPITVDGRPALKINHENVSWEGLQRRLQTVFAPSPTRVLFVKGDADIDFKCIAEAIDIARSAGIERVGLVTASMDGGR